MTNVVELNSKLHKGKYKIPRVTFYKGKKSIKNIIRYINKNILRPQSQAPGLYHYITLTSVPLIYLDYMR